MYIWQADYDRARHYSTLATQQFLLVSYYTLVNIIKEITPVVVYVKVCRVDSSFCRMQTFVSIVVNLKITKKKMLKLH